MVEEVQVERALVEQDAAHLDSVDQPRLRAEGDERCFVAHAVVTARGHLDRAVEEHPVQHQVQVSLDDEVQRPPRPHIEPELLEAGHARRTR
jgi:hypothetical protein